jgi:hypothetical protein
MNRRYPAMGSISTRAGLVAVATGPSDFRLPGTTGVPILNIGVSTLPNPPPQQPFHHQVQISGEIRLARTPGDRVRTQHKKATARK